MALHDSLRFPYIMAADGRFPAVGLHEAHQMTHRRGFAGPVRSEKAEYLAPVDGEGQLADAFSP
ncbi:hypothetical protein D3C73_1401350 [compost metagenome]